MPHTDANLQVIFRNQALLFCEHQVNPSGAELLKKLLNVLGYICVKNNRS